MVVDWASDYLATFLSASGTSILANSDTCNTICNTVEGLPAREYVNMYAYVRRGEIHIPHYSTLGHGGHFWTTRATCHTKRIRKRGQDARPSAGASHASHSPTYRGPCKRRWTALGWTSTACAMCRIPLFCVLWQVDIVDQKLAWGVLSHITVIQLHWIRYCNHIDCDMVKEVRFGQLTNTTKHWGDGTRLFGGLWCVKFAVGTPDVLQRCVQSKCVQFFGSIDEMSWVTNRHQELCCFLVKSSTSSTDPWELQEIMKSIEIEKHSW